MVEPKKKVAIIGAGIAGLYLAWKISKKFNVTVLEKNNYFGGHSNTIEVNLNKKIKIDTGFIVFNKKNYPNLANCFEKLGVKIQKSNMSFAVDLKNSNFYYAGSFKGLFAQKKNLLKRNFWVMLKEIIRFYKTTSKEVKKNLTLEEFLKKENYSNDFKNKHIYPMASAIWSTKKGVINKMPIKTFINFFNNHGLLNFFNRPTWYTVSGGSKKYVKKIMDNTDANFIKNIKVLELKKEKKKISVITNKNKIKYDYVVCACHANEAGNLLKKIDAKTAKIFCNFKYTKNKTYLHSDKRLMPQNKKIWSSWNYLAFKKGKKNYTCFTYWMNKLQNISSKHFFFVTLNSPFKPKNIFYETTYTHPVFTNKSAKVIKKINEFQGKKGIWFCGSYFSNGFHEDAVNSSIKIERLLNSEIS